mgnify:CR=1 FL=1
MCSRFGVGYNQLINDYLLVYNPATVNDSEDFIKLRLADIVLSSNARWLVVRASKTKNEGALRALNVPGLPPSFEVKYSILDDCLH